MVRHKKTPKDKAIQQISSLFGLPQKSATKVMPIKTASKKPINPLLSVLTKSLDYQAKKQELIMFQLKQDIRRKH